MFQRFGKFLAAAVVLPAIPIGTQASAATVFYDDFNGENGGATRLNYAGFANFDVSGGKVDLIGAGNLHKLVGSGSYVDLDGTKSGGGILTTKHSFSFNAGDLITLSFEASGNQRGKSLASDDALLAGFTFDGVAILKNFTLGGAFGSENLGGSNATRTSNSVLATWKAPYQIYTVSFLAGSAGALKAFIGTSSNDNVGPLLDNVRLTITSPVPEPGTWMALIIGLGVTGCLVRNSRRRQTIVTKGARSSIEGRLSC